MSSVIHWNVAMQYRLSVHWLVPQNDAHVRLWLIAVTYMYMYQLVALSSRRGRCELQFAVTYNAMPANALLTDVTSDAAQRCKQPFSKSVPTIYKIEKNITYPAITKKNMLKTCCI